MKSFKDFSISGKILVMLAVPAVGFIAYALFSYSTLNDVKIGSTKYDRILNDNGLVADILPPPLYVIESFLIANLMYTDTVPADFAQHIKDYKDLESQFGQRLEYWNTTLPDGPSKDAINGDLKTSGKAFFGAMDNQFIPLMQQGDPVSKAAARQLISSTLNTEYVANRAAVDKLVKVSSDDLTVAQNEANSATKRAGFLEGMLAVLIIVLSGVLALLISRQIKNPINAMVNRLRDIAQGEGDLTKRMEITSSDEMGILAQWFNKFVENIERLVSQVGSSVESIAATSQQLASSSQQVNAASQQVGSAVQEVASGSESLAKQTTQVSSATKELSDESQKGALAAKEAAIKMTSLAVAVEKSSTAVSTLGSKSQEIVGIVDTINSIAGQTNLLALNAAIEAARAGEAGRGFAVVADEVRKLAEESQGATKHIEQLIGEIKVSTDQAVKSMESGRKEVEDSGKVVSQALSSLELIGSRITLIESAVDSVAAVAQQSASSSQQMSAGVQQTGSSMEQVASAAQQLAATSQELQSLIGRFKVSEVLEASHPHVSSSGIKAAHVPYTSHSSKSPMIPQSVMQKIVETRDKEESS